MNKFLRVMSSQAKSSQVKFKMAVANPPPLVPLAGASDREGRTRRNRHHWIALSRGIIPIFLLLIIAAPQGFNIVPISGSLQVRQCNTATGRRWELSGACTSAATMGPLRCW